ncbi:MAG TPA: TadE family protein [Candidatus Limnocylindrales bacterium]
MAEFAIVLPVMMMVALVTFDAGRLLYSYLTITNAARVAASYAGANPFADWTATGPDDYPARVLDEGLGNLAAFCAVPNPAVPAPQFSDPSREIGDTASVTITCTFTPATPLVGSFAGGLQIGATAVFPIRQGLVTP